MSTEPGGTTPLPPGSGQRVDGRVARGLRTRNRMTDAMLGLFSEGVLRPTASAVAERAGVSLRSVFTHFADMESLFLAAAHRHAELVLPLYMEPFPSGTRAERVRQMARRRARIWEAVTPVRRAARANAPYSAQVTELLAAASAAHREEVCAVFPELDPSDPVLGAADLLFSWDAWEALRADRGIEIEAATAVVESGVGALMRGAGGRLKPGR